MKSNQRGHTDWWQLILWLALVLAYAFMSDSDYRDAHMEECAAAGKAYNSSDDVCTP